MRDLLMIAITGAFFALCIGYVALCDRIVGPDEPTVDDIAEQQGQTSEEVSAM